MLVLLLALCMAAPAAAVSGDDGNIHWDLTDGTLTISGNGAMPDYPSYNDMPWSSYQYRNSITKVIIESGITSIGYYAFAYCSNLATIELPDSITSIHEFAFLYCSNLTSIDLPDNVTYIGSYVFDGCCSLLSINVDEGNVEYRTIDGVLFSKDSTLLHTYPAGKPATSYAIPSSVTHIDSCAFEECNNLTSIYIPSGVTSIGFGAFRGCSGLTSIELPDSVTTIGEAAFASNSLTSIIVDEGNMKYRAIDGVLFSEDSTLLHTYPAGKSATSYNIPSGVTSIGSSAFEYCSNLISIDIPSGVTSIGSSAFEYCSNLISIDIPFGVTIINIGTFENCRNLTYVRIPSSVTRIDTYAFVGCDSLTSIELPDSITKIGAHVFARCNSLTSIELPDSITSIGDNAFINLAANSIIYCTDTSLLSGKYTTSKTALAVKNTDGSYTFTSAVTDLALSEANAPAGVTYGGWYKESSFTTQITSIAAGTNPTLWLKTDGIPMESHAITVTSTTGGSASVSPASAAAGTEITLTATADSGYVFKKWHVVEGDVSITGNKFTMPNCAVKIIAVFVNINSEETLMLESLTDEVVQGSYAPILLTAPAGVWTISVEDGEIPDAQANVNNIKSRDNLCYADITVPASGVATFAVKSTTTSSIKVRLYNQGTDTIAKSLIINVVPGAITAIVESSTVYIGDEFDVYGTNDFGGNLYFFLKGTNFPLSPIQKNGVTLTSSGKDWAVTVDTSQIRWNDKKLDAGTYTIYAVKLADGVTVNQISKSDDFDNEELIYGYAAVSVALKQPFISLTKTPEVVVQGEKFEVVGTAEGRPAEVMYYIFGTNYFKSGRSLVINSKFTVEMDKAETKKDKMAAGQYFIIVQHPMYDGLFNIGPVADGSGSYNIVLNKRGAFNDGDNTVLFRTQDRQSANAAQALCDALDSQDIDDMYVKASFIVAGPTSYIDPIPSQITKGQILTVSGTTTGHVGDIVTVELLSTAFAAIPKEVVGAASFATLSTRISETGVWFVSFDTSTLNADEYTCSVAVGQLDATTSKVTILDNPALPISLTVDKTNLHVSQDVTAVDVCFTYTIACNFDSAELSFGDGSQPVSLTERTGEIMHTYSLSTLSLQESFSSESEGVVLSSSGNPDSTPSPAPSSGSSRNYGSSVWLAPSSTLSTFTAVLTVNTEIGISIKSCTVVVTKDGGSSGSGGFIVTKAETVNPSGSLVVGENVTASMEIKLPKGSVDTASKLSFDTPLSGDVWTVDIIKGGTIVNTKHPVPPYLYIAGFDLDYDADVTVRINVEGIVPSDASGKEISVLMIRSDGLHSSSGISTYYSHKQFVYNPDNLNGELAVLNNAITTLDTRIASYIAYDRDVGKAQSYTEQARAKYLAAESAAASDAATAFANIEAGKKLVKQAQMELAVTSLTMSLSYTTATDEVITTLYSKGKSTEAKLVDTKNSGLKNTYSRLFAIYNSANVPDAASLDKLAADSLALWEEATGYLKTGLLESLTLSPGWNFISVPTKLAAAYDTAAELFSGVNTDDKAILSYKAESKQWKQVGSSTVIEPLNAYWIYSVEEKTILPEFDRGAHTPGMKTLKKGWNAVGLSAENPMPANVVFNGLNWRTYLSWNAAGQMYDSPLMKDISGTYGEENLVSLWKGGWVYMEEDGTYLGYA